MKKSSDGVSCEPGFDDGKRFTVCVCQINNCSGDRESVKGKHSLSLFLASVSFDLLSRNLLLIVVLGINIRFESLFMVRAS